MHSLGSRVKGKLFPIVGLVVLVFLFIIAYYPIAVDFNVFNPFWNGYDFLAKALNATLVCNRLNGHLPSNPKGCLLILVPYKPLSRSDLSALLGFVRGGGVLLLMDDFGYGNMVLEAMNAPVRFADGVLVDPLFYYKSTRIVRVKDFMGYLTGLNETYFNYGTVLRVLDGDKVRVLALSSPFSFLDRNFDGVYEPGEPYGPFPVVAEFKYGKGKVIVVSDPSVGINVMLKYGDNLEFFKRVCAGFRVFLDQTYTPRNLHVYLKEVVYAGLSFISWKPILTPLTIIVVVSVSLIISRKMRK